MLTGYAVAKKVNELLVSADLKVIPPQMVYNYISKGYIASENGLVTVEEAARWASEYITKKLTKV